MKSSYKPVHTMALRKFDCLNVVCFFERPCTSFMCRLLINVVYIQYVWLGLPCFCLVLIFWRFLSFCDPIILIRIGNLTLLLVKKKIYYLDADCSSVKSNQLLLFFLSLSDFSQNLYSIRKLGT